jgi:hypothetical protein
MPIRLKDDAIVELVARDARLRKPNGAPNHGKIISTSGVSSTHWWNIRKGFKDPGAEAIPKLLHLAMRTGLTEEEAYTLLFTTEPRETAAPLAA